MINGSKRPLEKVIEAHVWIRSIEAVKYIPDIGTN